MRILRQNPILALLIGGFMFAALIEGTQAAIEDGTFKGSFSTKDPIGCHVEPVNFGSKFPGERVERTLEIENLTPSIGYEVSIFHDYPGGPNRPELTIEPERFVVPANQVVTVEAIMEWPTDAKEEKDIEINFGCRRH